MGRALFVLAFLFLAIGLQAGVTPPVLVQREANMWQQPPAGVVVELDALTSTTFSLFVPAGVELGGDGATTLTIHFHGRLGSFVRSTPAAAGASLAYPLHTRADSGGFHWWEYGDDDAVAHMTFARHIAEAWDALDQLGDP